MKEMAIDLTDREVENIRKDFPMLRNTKTMQGQRFCYLDNASTSFKPDAVIAAGDEYYLKWNANTHRGDYDLAYKADELYAQARRVVAAFVNAKPEELIFTAGATMGINTVAFGLLGLLKKGDEILISEAEHASNVLPWFNIAKITGSIVRYIPLDNNGIVTIENLRKIITKNTAVVSLAHITNVLGSVNDIKGLAKVVHDHQALLVVDGAQSVPHMPVNVKDLDCDFLVFSAHKMCGPTGIGALYGKYDLLQQMTPLLAGGGMNTRFDKDGHISYELPPYKFEPGTQNVAGALGFMAACTYLSQIGLNRIANWERHLKQRVVEALKENAKVVVHNPDSPTGLLAFNTKGILAQDEGTLLNVKGICVRSGLHCAKILPGFEQQQGTVRASFSFYNNEADADQLVAALVKGGAFLDAYFA